MSAGNPSLVQLVEEAQRVLAICNACRYCEGYCAVFPALQRRLEFDASDVHYLANLCHNCGACLYACQYAPPHEFQLNFPRILAQVRVRTYGEYAWPRALAGAFEKNGTLTAIVTMLSIIAVLMFSAMYAGADRLFAAHSDAQGSFYAVLPHNVMAGSFGIVSLFVLLALVMGGVRFWRGAGDRESGPSSGLGGAIHDAATLKYLDGDGCADQESRPSGLRRMFHHFTFYGFLLCFAATSIATLYHYAFGWKAPYPLASVPVMLGLVGGVGLVIGPIGLAWLRARRDDELKDANQRGMDNGFLLLLGATSATGLALLFLRETAAMGTLLVVHLGVVLSLFLLLPYGKFMHAVYRVAALLRYHLERRRPPPSLGAE